LSSAAKKLELYKDLGSALGIALLPDALPPLNELQQKIEAHLRRELKATIGVDVIPNARIESDVLLTRSLRHIAPFASQGDRGLRDTIIYLTVLQHVKSRGVVEAILVTKDGDFQGLPGPEEPSVNLSVHNIKAASEILRQHLSVVVARQEQQKDEAVTKLIMTDHASLEQWIADRNRFVFSEQLLGMRLPPGATVIGSERPILKEIVRIERAPTDKDDPSKYRATCEATFSLTLDVSYPAFIESSTPLASGDSAGLAGISIVRSQFQQMQIGRAIIEYPIVFDLLVWEEGGVPVRFQIMGARDRDALLGALLASHLSTRIEPKR
jgi:hypothetical protein